MTPTKDSRLNTFLDFHTIFLMSLRLIIARRYFRLFLQTLFGACGDNGSAFHFSALTFDVSESFIHQRIVLDVSRYR